MSVHCKKVLFCRLTILAFSIIAIYSTMRTSQGIPRTSRLNNEAGITATLPKTKEFEWPCLEDIDKKATKSLQKNTASHNQTTSPLEPGSHLILSHDGNTEINKSILGNIWSFNEIRDQLLYVYEQLLKKTWTANLTNSDILRQELARYRTELNDSSTIIVHQKNIKVNGFVKHLNTKKSIKISPQIFRLLPKADPIGLAQGKRFSSCAVVGNSGSILNSDCGENVDKNDFVIRCNLAPLPPFKRDAGMKSNYTTMNPSIIRIKYRMLTKGASVKKFNEDVSHYDGILSIPCFGRQLSNAMKALTVFKGEKPKMVCMNTKHYQSVIDFWRKTGAVKKPLSTGFYMVSMAVQICDKIELYGFWPFSSRYGSNKTNVPYHYFDSITAAKASKDHAMNTEFSILLQLHNLGIVNLNVGSCR